MSTPDPAQIVSAEVLIRCDDVAAALDFYVERLGFRVDAIFPAESPTVAVLRGYGLRLRLDPAVDTSAVTLRLLCDAAAVAPGSSLQAPDGTLIELVDADPPIDVPELRSSFVLTRLVDDSSPSIGRAGMRYRDLIPDRQGGRFVASHIVIPDAGPVPDYVHFHKIRFQMIYCYRGWVRVVYEDQGEPFVMHAGDCVLQPPRIRHRVLESSARMEVIEITCPALHETRADPSMELPTGNVDRGRDYGGQRFLFHRAESAAWVPSDDGFERRRVGLREATGGLAEASVLRALGGPAAPADTAHTGELRFVCVLDGAVNLRRDGATTLLVTGDSVVIPAGMSSSLQAPTAGTELLEVVLPADAAR